ncbi:hypothetical protein DM01DRAFT_1337686, partial [Hesseltinella vesiculosa]
MDIKHSHTITHPGPSPGIMANRKLVNSLKQTQLGRRDPCWLQSPSEHGKKKTMKIPKPG